jgi:hypothetical protein
VKSPKQYRGLNPFEEYSERVRSVNALTGLCPGEDPELWGVHHDEYEALDLDLLRDCLSHAIESGEPLPPDLLRELITEVDRLRTGRVSELFKKIETRPSRHPDRERLEGAAVAYAEICGETKADASPIKTICKSFGVTPATVHRWKQKYRATLPSNIGPLQPGEIDPADTAAIKLLGELYQFWESHDPP